MVRSALKSLRPLVPLFGLIALGALFFKLPEAPQIFADASCKTCRAESPYLPLMGAAYFSFLIALVSLFPRFPGKVLARIGFVWAFFLGVGMTFLLLPELCTLCLIAHGCNLGIWGVLVLSPESEGKAALALSERLCFAAFGTVSILALFGSMNITLLVYNLKSSLNPLAGTLKAGDPIPEFSARTTAGITIDEKEKGVILNFVALNCPYCKEQLALLSKRSGQKRLILIAPVLDRQLVELLPDAEWVEDKEGSLAARFKIAGYPTLMIFGGDGTIAEVIPGVPNSPFVL